MSSNAIKVSTKNYNFHNNLFCLYNVFIETIVFSLWLRYDYFLQDLKKNVVIVNIPTFDSAVAICEYFPLSFPLYFSIAGRNIQFF